MSSMCVYYMRLLYGICGIYISGTEYIVSNSTLLYFIMLQFIYKIRTQFGAYHVLCVNIFTMYMQVQYKVQVYKYIHVKRTIYSKYIVTTMSYHSYHNIKALRQHLDAIRFYCIFWSMCECTTLRICVVKSRKNVEPFLDYFEANLLDSNDIKRISFLKTSNGR